MFAWGGRNWILNTLLLISICLLVYILTNIQILLILTIFLFILELFILNFFRDPIRQPGPGIVSPADGKVLYIEPVKLKSQNKKYIRVAIFMSAFCVHVNRAPISGRVISMIHKPGGYTPAYKKISKQNERLITKIDTSIGEIELIQIAGILAKRIVPYIKQGQILKKGQRIGIIQFGSRVDVILPMNRIQIKVRPDQQLKAGTSTIALPIDK